MFQSPRSAGELHARQDVDRLAAGSQADAPGVEGQGVLPDPAELENPRVLEEKIALLREEQREPGEIHPPLVHLRLGEVGVHRASEGERRGQLEEHVEPGVEIHAVAVLFVIPA